MLRPYAAEVEHPNVRAVRVGHRERGSSCVRRAPGWHRVRDLEPSGDQCGLKPPVITSVKSEPSGAKVEIATWRSRLFAIASPSRTTVRSERRPSLRSRIGSARSAVVSSWSRAYPRGVLCAQSSPMTRCSPARGSSGCSARQTSTSWTGRRTPTSWSATSDLPEASAARISRPAPPGPRRARLPARTVGAIGIHLESTTAAARLHPRRSPRHTIRRGSRLRTVELRLDEVAGEAPVLTPPTPGSAGCPTVGGPGRSPCDRRRRPSRRCS